MITRCYTIQFLTPAFLGDAEQNGRWRTPPFKAQLRQWWRVAYAASQVKNEVDVAKMRWEEGLLFGNAWLAHQEGNREVADHCKSLVRLRLRQWERGKLGSWNGLEQAHVNHPEVQRTGFKVGPHAYLGYGPLDGRGNTKFSEKVNAAIQAGENNRLSLAWPQRHDGLVEHALWLMDRYGTVGGRSRNGWGSFHLKGQDEDSQKALTGAVPLRKWQDCLDCDWPHAIGQDEAGSLIWQTKAFDDWKTLMRELAIIKIGLRTQFMYDLVPDNGDEPIKNKHGEQVGINHGSPQQRHWLSYPVTHHPVSKWGQNIRLPNSLRFKVRQASGDPKKLVGVIFHMPHLPPAAFNPNRSVIVAVWNTVHRLLDELTKPNGRRSYSMIADAKRRTKLKPHLDQVTLTRIPE